MLVTHSYRSSHTQQFPLHCNRIEPSFLRVQNTDHLFFLCGRLSISCQILSWLRKAM